MGKGRLEAFSDGVLAITIMVLEMKVPHGTGWADLRPLVPVFLSYVLSFVYVGIYWNNHHHLLHAAHKINGKVMWANNHLLFWLSLLPFSSGWMGENHFAPLPTALFGLDLLMAAVAYYILTRSLISLHGKKSTIGSSIGAERKEKVSMLIYAASVPLAFIAGWISLLLYTAVAVLWLIPDKRIELKLAEELGPHEQR
ncbi:MAG: DUF1211 domain-containing protein [Chitinophagaceae bacterium]|nr:DUF1211 domain-containing protein [Chitinophagaceae bacterium]MCA6452757.1 DUF1211 domain-containing protein [Chitinophagaceae bacterium]MCA6457778.1 DUF1211 domain-containing protein [Chitinophagaceae bacterium]MCA6463491.1 DUF1211 domain-containing protein [Chitinophagaceae bacterium]